MSVADQKILEEAHDPNYQPTEDELKEYAEWLGLDFKNEQACCILSTLQLF